MMISAAALLSSCGIYGKYERPEVNTAGLVRDVASNTDTLAVSDTASFGNLPWRSVFTDPQLQALIEQGLTHNTDLLNAALNVKMVESQLLVSKLAFVPSFTFSPQGTISSWDGSKASKTYSLPINASWSIDLFGNLLNQKRSAQMVLLATKDYQLVVKTNLIANIANAYYTLLMLDKQLEIVNNMTGLTKDTWDMMKLQKDLNMAKETSVQSAEANYYSVLAQAEDLKRQIRETENSLSLLLGQPAQTIGRGKLENQSLPTEFSTGVGIQMLNNRPDVHYAEMTLAQCFYDVQTARSKFYPNISISGSGAYTNNGGGGIFRFIKPTAGLPELEHCFEVHRDIPVQKYADLFDLRYFEIVDEASATEVLPRFFAERERPAILAVYTPNVYNAEVLRGYFRRARQS